MNVTHQHEVLTAHNLGALVHLESPKTPARFICSLCGEEGPAAESIPHKPNCPEAKKKGPKTAA